MKTDPAGICEGRPSCAATVCAGCPGGMPERTWAEVDLAAVQSNFRALRREAGPNDAILVVVKADAYGHGLVPVAQAAYEAGASHFGVATVAEGAALRHAAISGEVHVLTPLLPSEADDCARLGLTPYISSLEFLEAYSRLDAPFPPSCFLMVDTGMGREGLDPETAARVIAAPPASLRVAGVASHLASADEPDQTLTCVQEQRFGQWLRTTPGVLPGMWRSLANSPGMLRVGRPDDGPVLWRPGALLYGISPYPDARGLPNLAPVLGWKARVTLVRTLPAGSTVGYGATATLARDSRIATLAAGYADGLSRRLSNRGVVLVHGTRCPIVGRVSMDQCQIDVTDTPQVQIGDVATLLGRDGSLSLGAETMAAAIETTVHEPTTCLSARVPRRFHCAGMTRGTISTPSRT